MKYPETARRLNEAMNDINIKAVDLSARSGVSKSSISHYMNGTHTPSNVAATALSEVLGVNPVWLMGFDAPKTTDDRPRYIIDPDAEKMIVDMYENPDLRVVFDCARKVKPEDLEQVAKLIKTFIPEDSNDGC